MTLEHLEHTPWYHWETYAEALRADADQAAGRAGDDEWVSEEEYYAGRQPPAGDGGELAGMGMAFEVVDLDEERDKRRSS